MKLVMAAAAVAALVTSSAYAEQASSQARLSPKASFTYARSLVSEHFGAPHISGNAVYVDGRIVGQDPDPNVRLQLLRDPPGITQ